ncbi:predicted protein [Sclerotinia sclerotiorum 1980 UF-70]|uniref:Uncharacterized protein n=1 Tax=Sclerotinia sclerotiorum (strain ATCC 18683 / 1980 / Ss-1) TaxID=665079 RepID=A7EJM2_SCLS1|nr:predicted protein [Sclerotinia sclerotiorum 1980 UF-70]EDO03038.1 predicted protein [Sclerotinia sclerotiorum 1980 UF-70]
MPPPKVPVSFVAWIAKYNRIGPNVGRVAEYPLNFGIVVMKNIK